MTKVIELVNDVELFKADMIRVLGLKKNVAKEHYKTGTVDSLFGYIEKNLTEMSVNVNNLRQLHENEKLDIEFHKIEVQERCTDISNLCMMLWNLIEQNK